MSAIVPSQAATPGASRARSTGLRAIEKGSASSLLGHGKSNADTQRQKNAAPLQVELVYRDETNGFDPFWDAPRLVPTFIAQLLGQVMAEQHQSGPANNPYGPSSLPHKAKVLDFKS
jgi:hypothetical protein